MKKNIFLLMFVFVANNKLCAQTDPEFKKGFILHLQLQQGVQTNFHRGADLYVASVMAMPQFTVIPSKLRVGAATGFYYLNKKFLPAAGPLLTYKLKTFQAGAMGSFANVNLRAEHLWLPDKKTIAGLGLQLDLLNKLQISLMAHRAYLQNEWWFQTGLGLRLSKIKKDAEPFNE